MTDETDREYIAMTVMIQRSLRLDLERIARLERRTLSNLVRLALEQYVASDHEINQGDPDAS